MAHMKDYELVVFTDAHLFWISAISVCVVLRLYLSTCLNLKKISLPPCHPSNLIGPPLQSFFAWCTSDIITLDRRFLKILRLKSDLQLWAGLARLATFLFRCTIKKPLVVSEGMSCEYIEVPFWHSSTAALSTVWLVCWVWVRFP